MEIKGDWNKVMSKVEEWESEKIYRHCSTMLTMLDSLFNSGTYSYERYVENLNRLYGMCPRLSQICV